MKRIFVLFSLLALFGCSGLGIQTTFNQPCSIYEEIGATPENSLIASKIDNPCAAQKLLATAAKLPAVWGEKKYTDLFETWASKLESVVKGGTTYSGLQNMIVMEISKLNRKAGMVLLIISYNVLVFNESISINSMDMKLLLMSLEDLRKQVKQMAIVAE